MIKGGKGLIGRGAVLVAVGVAIPVLYMTLAGGPQRSRASWQISSAMSHDIVKDRVGLLLRPGRELLHVLGDLAKALHDRLAIMHRHRAREVTGLLLEEVRDARALRVRREDVGVELGL